MPPGAAAVHARIGFIQHRIGDRIKDRYEVLERLGGGNFGSVYKVRDTVVGNILACKEMHVLDDPHTSSSERELALELFKREALNLATLRHPNIPAAYFEQADGVWRICPRCGHDFPAAPVCPDHGAQLLPFSQRYYLMMDFVDGPTLEELVVRQGRPLEEKQSLIWIEQIGSALQSLHRVGIVHRDIKPDNIKISVADKTAMLLDFGLTKKVEEAGGYGTVSISGTTRFGTVGYAPENLHERENPERRSDIYALGMTLYRMLSGRDPQEPDQLREMRDFTPRYFNKSISPETERLISVATASEMSWRYQTIEEFLAELKEIHTSDDAVSQVPALVYADGSRARSAGDLARLIKRYPDETQRYLFNGTLVTWLQQNGFAAAALTAMEVIEEYKEKPQRALEYFRRSLFPQGATGVLPRIKVRPKVLDFGTVESGATLAKTLRIRNEGEGLLWGIIAFGKVDDQPKTLPGVQFPKEFESNDSMLDVKLDTRRVSAGVYQGTLAIESNAEPRSGVRVVHVPISYRIEPLQLRVEPPELDFGTVAIGRKESRTVQLCLKDPSLQGGQPRGAFYVGGNLKGVHVPERFEGTDPVEIVVDANASNVVAQLYEGALQLDTNGGRFRVPIRYRITLAPERALTMLASSSVIGAFCGAALRAAYALVDPFHIASWLVRERSSGVLGIVGASSEGSLWWNGGMLLSGLLLGGFFSQTLSKQAVSEVKHRRNPALRSFITLFCVVFGALLGWLAGFLLHYLFWGFGDWLLYPLAHRQTLFPQGNPLVAWGVLGTGGGLLWGVVRAGTAMGHSWLRYAVPLLLAFCFLLLLINAMLV